ncbi:DUF1552 domain-containing protein [Cellvibrio fibrivorans]|uniref:DUF1552 domain-containing protein n=1 Tax=Cellvibrio fibrivorans TaxID=126350 RepID=A0ABU1UZ53_9GAMM|nr:DUF1552 domain-containing protein [Cellvibrio fibrivorans]MDR7090477.1 hypothetical protein [Cellvibrio fibrivorans]
MKTQEKNFHNKRRQLLKMMASAPLINTGLITAGVGFANAARAATSVKNVIFVFIPGGAPRGATSVSPDAAFNLKPASAPLEPVKNECVFFGADMNGHGHGLAQTALGGLTRAPKTIDLALGDVLGGSTPFKSIQLGVLSRDTSVSAINSWTRTPVITDPARAFEILRTGSSLYGTGFDQQQKQLSINLRAVQQLQQQLSNFASTRLQANQDAIAELQAELSPGGFGPDCDLQQQSWPTGSINPNDGQQFTRLWELQTNNAVTAIKCGLTHVVTMLMGNDEEDFVATGFNYSYAQAANGFPGSAEYTAYRAYLSQRLTHLIQQLQTNTDINGAPLLDSTLVVQVTNMADTSDNTGINAPFMFAGGGSSIRKGQVLRAAEHTQIMDTVALAVGAYGIIAPYSSQGPIPGVVV